MSNSLNERREQVKATKHERIKKIIEKLNPPQPMNDEQLRLVLGMKKEKK